MSDNEIRASEAAIRANAHESTLQSLKELLLLAKIAEAENIEVDEEDLEVEIEAMAERTGESPRRIRSRLDKEGMTEDLTTQILERKVIDRILESSTIEDDVMAAAEPEGGRDPGPFGRGRDRRRPSGRGRGGDGAGRGGDGTDAAARES